MFLQVGPQAGLLCGELLGGAGKDFLFQNGGGKTDIKLTTSGQGKILRPEIERSDRPEARQKSGLGWRGHKKLKKKQYIIENP